MSAMHLINVDQLLDQLAVFDTFSQVRALLFEEPQKHDWSSEQS